jgi:hypothetical protein
MYTSSQHKHIQHQTSSRAYLHQQRELLPPGQEHSSKQQQLLLTLRHLLWLTQQVLFNT